MNRTKVSSSNIAEVGYDAGTLEVLYHSGSIYQYLEVPEEIYRGLMEAKSLGIYMNTLIKGKYQYNLVGVIWDDTSTTDAT